MENLPLFAFTFGPMEMAIVALVTLLLFGHRVPLAMKGLGASVKEFRKAVKGDNVQQELEEPSR